MMRTIRIISFLVAVTLLVSASIASTDMIREDIEFYGRPVIILLPENYDRSDEPIPLVLHLHGAIPDPTVPELELDNSGYRDLPSKYKVMVVAPRASLDLRSGLYDWDSFDSLSRCGTVNEDDVRFLNNLLDKLLEDYPVDPHRVYIYGYSSGAAMAHRMACANAERFAGIAAGAGFIYRSPQLCEPSMPISILQFHSVSDEVIMFDGGNLGDIVGDPDNPGCDHPSAIELLTQWANRNGCAGTLELVHKPPFNLTTPGFADPPGIEGGVKGNDTTVHQFGQCPNGYDVELWKMQEGVPHPPLFFRVGPNGVKVLAEKSWKFLRHHKR